MTLDSVVSPQVLNKYLILVDVKSGDSSNKVGEQERRQKSVSLPPKAGELASITQGLEPKEERKLPLF